MKWRKINRVLHRDFGFFFFGMTIIYAISGIALNHLHHWNPNYVIDSRTENIKIHIDRTDFSNDRALKILEQVNVKSTYKQYYFPSQDELKIFVNGGSVAIDLNTGEAYVETIRRRPFFRELNFLHYNNPRKLYTWFSDIFAASLMLIAITGLFIIKGKKGITGRGAWLTIVGILLPIVFLIGYL